MWQTIGANDEAFVNGPERWANTSVDDYMAYLLGELIPGPDGARRGWRFWADTERNRLLCEENYRTPKRFAATWHVPTTRRVALAGG
ncbi:MAG: hypothetical protein U0793_22790 [Gemmataceae bacterium]